MGDAFCLTLFAPSHSLVLVFSYCPCPDTTEDTAVSAGKTEKAEDLLLSLQDRVRTVLAGPG